MKSGMIRFCGLVFFVLFTSICYANPSCPQKLEGLSGKYSTSTGKTFEINLRKNIVDLGTGEIPIKDCKTSGTALNGKIADFTLKIDLPADQGGKSVLTIDHYAQNKSGPNDKRYIEGWDHPPEFPINYVLYPENGTLVSGTMNYITGASSDQNSGQIAISVQPDSSNLTKNFPASIGVNQVTLYVNPNSLVKPNLNFSNVDIKEITSVKQIDIKSSSIVITASAKVDRQILDKGQENSTVSLGQRDTPNPAYQDALIDYQRAQSELNAAKASGSSGIGLLGYALDADDTRKKLRSTPRTIRETVRKPYSFQTSRVESKKVVTGEIILINTSTKSYKKIPYNESDASVFDLAFGVDPKDENLNQLSRQYKSEKSVDEYEKQPLYVDGNKLIEKLKQDTSPTLSFKKLTDVIKDYSTEKSYEFSNAEISPVGEDERFGSVVVVSNPDSMGTGFFVGEKQILTNDHVLSGHTLAEVTYADGRKILGKVIKRDLNRDLALIEITESGIPVSLFSGPVKVGQSVDLVGHPKGLSYSMSRGIVSSIRDLNNPTSKGGRKVRYIQTDAVINSGNSGGPMFIGNKVVGVNTQKLTGSGVEGIGFAIHVDEIKQFLLGVTKR